MKCYFDNDAVNLSNIDQIKTVRTYKDLLYRTRDFNLEFVTTTNYSTPGIYLIEVSKHSYDWCTKKNPSGFRLLNSIPYHVIEAARNKKIRIVILSVVEGDTFNFKYDCYAHLTRSFKQLNLPPKSVLIVSGNLKANEQYQKWCEKKNEIPLIEFISGIDWFGESWNKQTEPIFYTSIKHYTKLYNSLNRAHRTHRTDHLYYLAKHNLIDKGMVSGGAMFDDNPFNIFPKFIIDDAVNYKNVLSNNYPKTIDVSVNDTKISNLASCANLEIFKNTLLTVSTETFFDDPGMFITEKTFRPIAMGHPFIILGQVGILKKLQSYGFRTDFIDTSYDDITDHKKRFAKFHESFLSWINDDKEKYYNKWLSIVEHNLYIYKQLDFRKQYLDEIVSSTKKYFKEFS
jgi:hypothetical protein